MNNLIWFLLLTYLLFCYGYIFGWAFKLYYDGYIKTKAEKDSWILYYIFAPIAAPFIYALVLEFKSGE